MAKSIPTEIEIVNGIKLKVVEKVLPTTHLGFWDPDTKSIYINATQSDYSKWETLFHEVLHAIDDELILAGKKKIAFSERSIEFAASALLGFMVLNNLTDLVSKKNLKDVLFIENTTRDFTSDDIK